MTPKFYFPALHRNAQEIKPAGYAEVSTDARQEKVLPPDRFMLANAINGLYQAFPKLDNSIKQLYWNPITTSGISPAEWKGNSANLACFLALLHHFYRLNDKRIQTDVIWASGAIECNNNQVELTNIGQIFQKIEYFMSTCQGQNAVLLLPAESYSSLTQEQLSFLKDKVVIQHYPEVESIRQKDGKLIICFIVRNRLQHFIDHFFITKNFTWLYITIIFLVLLIGIMVIWNEHARCNNDQDCTERGMCLKGKCYTTQEKLCKWTINKWTEEPIKRKIWIICQEFCSARKRIPICVTPGAFCPDYARCNGVPGKGQEAPPCCCCAPDGGEMKNSR
jgi:hypothetical protein